MMTKPCKQCGKQMILCWNGQILSTYPPQYLQEWKCGCSYIEEGPNKQPERLKTNDECFQLEWQAANETKEKLEQLEILSEAEKPPIQIQLIHPDAKIPTKATPYSAGYDVCAIEEQIVRTHETKPFFSESPYVGTLVKLGFKIAIPIGYEIQIRPRSGLALKYGITCLNSPGTIDSDYRGEVGVILINHSNQEYTIKKGDRIAQMIVAKAPESEFILVNDLETTERGEGGYGHSGK